MNDDQRAGIRAQYRELLDSAQTVDLLVQQYAEVGRSQDDLKVNKIFEIHMAKIALHDYKNRTSNHTGAEYVSGRGTGLLPSKQPGESLRRVWGILTEGEEEARAGPKAAKEAPEGPAIIAENRATSRRTARRRPTSRQGSSRRRPRARARRAPQYCRGTPLGCILI